MATNVDVPPLGESVREAVLIKWHKNDGDTVTDQEPVAELETDKANVDVPAPVAGVLRRVKNEGDTVAIGDTIARIDEGGAGAGNAKPQANKSAPLKPPPVAASQPAPASQASPTPGGAGYGGQVTAPKPSSAPLTAPAASNQQSTKGTDDLRPSVRRVVDEKNLDGPAALPLHSKRHSRIAPCGMGAQCECTLRLDMPNSVVATQVPKYAPQSDRHGSASITG